MTQFVLQLYGIILTGEQQDKIVTDLESQVSELQDKIKSLEGTIRDKDADIKKLQDADRNKENVG
jgi:chaperonin cofactor prefoldin